MPNWCSNYVQVSHPDREKIVMLRRAFRQGRMLNYIHPIPECLKREGAAAHGGPCADEYDRIRAENRELTGYESWYDFCVSQWGTKWDVGERGSDRRVDANSATFSFDSAWSPPTNIYEKMVEQGYTVDAMYFEPGMGFCGRFVDGDDCFYDLSGLTSNEVAYSIDSDIDECFGISESMAEYEEEQRMEDELYRWTKEGGEKLALTAA